MKKSEDKHYLNHLSNVAESNRVIVQEDIFNENGALLVPSGTEVSASISRKLLAHKLNRNLDDIVQLEVCLKPQKINADLTSFLKDYPDLYFLDKAYSFSSAMSQFFHTLTLPRVLLQKLTVLKNEFADHYQKTLFVTWFSTLTARAMKLSPRESQDVFLASLYCDLGLLHIDSEIVDQDILIDEQEVKAYRSHPLISQAIAKNASSYSDEMLRAIAEHHERGDGQGYPRNLSREKLSLMGQIIGLANVLYDIRMTEFKNSHHTIMEFAPYLMVNLRAFPVEITQSVYQLLHRSKLPLHHNLDKSNFVAHCKQLVNSISALNVIDQQFTQAAKVFIASELQDDWSQNFQRSILSIMSTIQRSGVANSTVASWIAQLTEADWQETNQEIVEIQHIYYWLMQGVSSCINQLDSYINGEACLPDYKEPLNSILQKLQRATAEIEL